MNKFVIGVLLVMLIGCGYLFWSMDSNELKIENNKLDNIVDKPDENIDIEDWKEMNKDSLENIEKLFSCAEKSGLDLTTIMANYMECASNKCISLEGAKFDTCVDGCFGKDFDTKINKLINNPIFRICIER